MVVNNLWELQRKKRVFLGGACRRSVRAVVPFAYHTEARLSLSSPPDDREHRHLAWFAVDGGGFNGTISKFWILNIRNFYYLRY